MRATSSELYAAPRFGQCLEMSSALIIGNSDGIGLALTRLLLVEGWQVNGVSRSPNDVAAPGYQHDVLDVRSEKYSALLSDLITRRGGVDVCVYCAGIGERVDIDTLATDRRVFETNLLGAVATAEVVIPAMVRAGRGHFIGLSSQADALVNPDAPSYSASKAGLSSYLEGLALACRPRGVYVTNVRLGFVDTKMAKAAAKPFMVSALDAARRVRRCIEKRPVRDSFPKRMVLLLGIVRFLSGVKRWFGF